MSGLPDQRLRSRCLGMIASLPVPGPFDLEQFRVGLERHRGRPLLFLPAETAGPCSGMWIGTDAADFIFYAQDTTPVHQRHIAVHEIGHMVFGHQGFSADGDEFARALFPHLDPALVRSALVRSALARSAYSSDEEAEAETFASVLLDRAGPAAAGTGLAAGDAEVLHRIRGAFSSARAGYRVQGQ